MASIDTHALLNVIDQTYALSEDPTCPPNKKAPLAALADRLTVSLNAIAGSQFSAASQSFTNATTTLDAANANLANMVAALGALAKTIDQITALANALDGLLKLVP